MQKVEQSIVASKDEVESSKVESKYFRPVRYIVGLTYIIFNISNNSKGRINNVHVHVVV